MAGGRVPVRVPPGADVPRRLVGERVPGCVQQSGNHRPGQHTAGYSKLRPQILFDDIGQGIPVFQICPRYLNTCTRLHIGTQYH